MSSQYPLTPLDPWIAGKIGQTSRPLDREALHSYQLARLTETLSLVRKNSRFYRATLGPKHTPLSSLDDLAGLPFSSSDDLRAAPLDFLCVPQSEVHRIVTLPTSGTTGTPKRIYFTAADQELTRDFFHHGMSTMVSPGDVVLILLPASLPGSVGDLLREGLARMDVRGIPHGPVDDPWEVLEVMRRERVTAMVGVPVQVFALAKAAAANGPPRPSSVHSVLLSTDRVPGPIAGMIERTWDCSVYNHYGMTETGLGGGVDCRARAGYHLREADLLYEIVDPATGRVLPDGETGEVVVTTLTRQAMPFVRYRTGDVGRFIPESCSCGTALKRMAHIEDRIAGHLVLPDGAVVRQRDFDEVLFALEGVLDFRVVVQQAGSQMHVRIEVKRDGQGAPNPSDVQNALLSLRPLSDAAARGQVSLTVERWDWSQGVSMGKRRITFQGGAA